MAVKTCYKCKESKPIDEFHKNARKPDGVQNYCKVCAKVRNREYYLATPERNPQRRATNVRNKEVARNYVWDYLLGHPCVDCGEANPVVLEFDHVTGDKVSAISNLIRRGFSVEKIKEEIAKCEVRCANCHRIVTAARGNWWAK